MLEEGKRIVGMHLIKSNDYNDSVCEQVNESYNDLNTSIGVIYLRVLFFLFWVFYDRAGIEMKFRITLFLPYGKVM